MSAWIGNLGQLVELKCPASAPYSQAPDVQIDTTLGGRDKAQIGRTIAREWTLDVGPSYAGAATALTRFHHGLYGNGPWWFIDPWAAATNVLTPAQSMPGPRYPTWTGSGTPAGAWSVPDVGFVYHSLITDGGTATFGAAPVIPGKPVSGGIYVAGSGEGRVSVQVLDQNGAILTTQIVRVQLTYTPVWVTVTLPLVPANGVSARVVTAGGVQQAGLVALSWSSTQAGWTPGQGCNRALIDTVNVEPRQAVPGVSVFATHSAKIQELRG